EDDSDHHRLSWTEMLCDEGTNEEHIRICIFFIKQYLPDRVDTTEFHKEYGHYFPEVKWAAILIQKWARRYYLINELDGLLSTYA
ncbi:hypothetical protein, partial [Salmonella sp. SAL4450]|uniref:hypothetical protein n=1 Tax=Salmonella sp. SAL4450 TaxID=3159905 RepID=UPI00397B718B